MKHEFKKQQTKLGDGTIVESQKNAELVITTDLAVKELVYDCFIEPFVGHPSISADWGELALMGIKEAAEIVFLARRAFIAPPDSEHHAPIVRIVPSMETGLWADLSEEQAGAVRRLGERHAFAAEDMKRIMREKAELEERDRLETQEIQEALDEALTRGTEFHKELYELSDATARWEADPSRQTLQAMRAMELSVSVKRESALAFLEAHNEIAYQKADLSLPEWTPPTADEEARRDQRLAELEARLAAAAAEAAEEEARAALADDAEMTDDQRNDAAKIEAESIAAALVDAAIEASSEEAAAMASERARLETLTFDASPPHLRPKIDEES